MSTRYLVANALISVKNARSKGYQFSNVVVPYSGLTLAVLKKLEQYGYVSGVSEVADGVKKNISVDVKFNQNGISLVRMVKIISKPGARIYYTVEKLRHINMRNKFNLVIVSTSKGIMSIAEALESGLGGEAVCEVF